MQRFTIRTEWDGSSPPNNITQVWNHIANNLGGIRHNIQIAAEEFYGNDDRLQYLSEINDALQAAKEISKFDKPVVGYVEIEKLLKVSPKSVIRPKLLTKAQDTLQPFLERLKSAVQKAHEGRNLFDDEVLAHLEMFCSNYMKLDLPDDDYFQALRTKTLKIRDHLRNYDHLSSCLRDSSSPDESCYCSDVFGKEIAEKFDCHQVPVLRIIPDIIQKFETMCTIANDWLRSDKVYMEQLESQIDNTKLKIQEAGSKSHMTNMEYERKFETLKRRKMELEEYDESYDSVWREITQMETKKTQLEIEIHTVIKTLKQCREQLEELKTAEQQGALDVMDSVAPEYDSDEDREDEDEVDSARHIATASYRSRLCRDARGHTVRLNYLKKKKKQMEMKIVAKRDLLQDLESNEEELQGIVRKLRLMAKKKSKHSETIGILTQTLEGLEQMFHYRMNPTCRTRTDTYDRQNKYGRSRVTSFGRVRGNSFGRARLDSFGRARTRTNSFGLRHGSFGQRHGSFGMARGSFSQRHDSLGRRNGSFGQRNGSFGQRTNSFGTRTNSVGKRAGSFAKSGPVNLWTARKRIQDVQKAFRIVKNKIGLSWKDLARSLPYEPIKEIHEIDDDIKTIEYEHRGELKEQAYQALVRWYSHSGRRASVNLLAETLRDINENRLAEEIATESDSAKDEKSALQEVKEEPSFVLFK